MFITYRKKSIMTEQLCVTTLLLYIPSLIEDETLCREACVVGNFAVLSLTAAADTWEVEDDEEDDVDNAGTEVTDMFADGRDTDAGRGGLFG